MSKKTDKSFKLKLPIEVELTEQEYRQLDLISDGDAGKIIAEYLKELAAGKKKIKSFKKNCPFCDRMIIIYTDGYKVFLNSVRSDMA